MGIVRPVMEVFPLAWIFFLLFILASTFTLLNLFIAVIVSAMHREHDTEAPPAGDSEIAQLRREIAALRNDLQRGRASAPGATARA
jgi:voltage-gated sodium channel